MGRSYLVSPSRLPQTAGNCSVLASLYSRELLIIGVSLATSVSIVPWKATTHSFLLIVVELKALESASTGANWVVSTPTHTACSLHKRTSYGWGRFGHYVRDSPVVRARCHGGKIACCAKG